MKRIKQFLSWLAIALICVFSVDVVARAAQGLPIFQVSGGVAEGSLVNSGGRVGITSHEYLNEIREGNIADHTFVRLAGNNMALGTTFGELSQLYTAGYGNWPAVEGLVTLVSDSALDSTSGTGALTVKVSGLDSTFTPLVQTVTMQGLNSAFTLDSYFRVDDLEVVTAGSGLTNAGLITAIIGGADIIALQDGHSKTTEGRKTTAAGETMYLQGASGSVIGTSKNAAFHLFARDTQVTNAPFILQQIFQAQGGGNVPDGLIMGIAEKTDVIIVGSGTAGSNVAEASWYGWIEQ